MAANPTFFIAGAGGIAQAAALILAEWSTFDPVIFICNRTLEVAERTVDWVNKGTSNKVKISAVKLDHPVSEEMKKALDQSDVLLDCLPGFLAPKMAQLAKEYDLHYVNLTEYVQETEEIKLIGENAKRGFVLQTGLAPGYINVLGNYLFKEFCIQFKVDKIDKLEMKVGALTVNAVEPHFYGFTWSPVGVATEYIKDAIVVRNYQKRTVSSLSERKKIIIHGITYEEDLTSGGVANLADALSENVKDLDYKTLRYPGHYSWVERTLQGIKGDKVNTLQKLMESEIPHVEDDQIVLYAAVEGKDAKGILRRNEVVKKIKPMLVGKHILRAIQTTTAVPMLASALMLLEQNRQGIVLQSEIEPSSFLNGNFIKQVYGSV